MSIARALAGEPELLILDEATASLDVSVQARVLDLLATLQRDMDLTYLFIAHDLAVVQQISHDILVMRTAKLSNTGPRRICSRHRRTSTPARCWPPSRRSDLGSRRRPRCRVSVRVTFCRGLLAVSLQNVTFVRYRLPLGKAQTAAVL